eukprot:SAG11_NODE_2444_length_3354_cov_2.476498_6_plen_91_part_00
MAFLKKLFNKDAPSASQPEPEPEPEAVVSVGAAEPEAADDDESPFFGRKVNRDSFDLLKTVGKGSFGHVMLVRKRDTCELLAMKVSQRIK